MSGGPVFPGIRIPTGAYLPMEIIQAMPYMSLAEMRVVLAVVYHSLQFGGGLSLTLSDFERLTGLARASVISGLNAAIERGFVIRYPVPGYRGSTEYLYELNAYPEISGSKFEPLNETSGSKIEPLNIGGDLENSGKVPTSSGSKFEPLNETSGSKFEPLNIGDNPEKEGVPPTSSGSKFEPLNIGDNPEKEGVPPISSGSKFEPLGGIKLSSTAVNLINNLTAAPYLTLNGGETKKLNRLGKNLNRLRGCGVYLTVAHQLIREYPPERIEAFLTLYPLAVRVYGVGPGWLVSVIKGEQQPEEILTDLQAVLQDAEGAETASKTEALPEKQTDSALPPEIETELKSLGWRGSLAEVEKAWREDPERVRQWLWYAGKQGMSGALLRTVLRSAGEYPPELDPNSPAVRRRYIEGPYADIIQH